MATKVTLIAECASNWGGNLRTAQLFIERFAAAGADFCKFQLTRVAHLSRTDPQYEWFTQAEVTTDKLLALVRLCRANHVQSLFTVYNPAEVPLMRPFRHVKVGSGEAHRRDLAEALLGGDFETIFVADGIRQYPAHALYEAAPNVVFLGCESRYPCSEQAAVRAMANPRNRGWSDHCIGLGGCRAAVECGARYLEKHVQIREQARAARPFEATVDEFAELRRWVDDDPERFIGRWAH